MRIKSRLRGWLSRLVVGRVGQDYLLLTVGSLLMAANLRLFLAPSSIAPGGVSGLAIILNALTGWPIGVTMLVLNIPLVAMGFWQLGRFRFLARTAYVVLLYNLGVDIMARWIPPTGVTEDLLLNALYGGVVGGIGMGLVYRGGGTSAGTGILSRVLQLRTGVPVSQIYLVTDGGVILAAGLVFGWERGLYALLTLFVWGMVADYVLEGPSVVRTAFIVTDRPQEVAQVLLSELRLGVTAWPAWGMFTERERTVLFCTVSRPMEGELRSLVAKVDPEGFVAIVHGHQARGGTFGPPPSRRDRKEGDG